MPPCWLCKRRPYRARSDQDDFRAFYEDWDTPCADAGYRWPEPGSALLLPALAEALRAGVPNWVLWRCNAKLS